MTPFDKLCELTKGLDFVSEEPHPWQAFTMPYETWPPTPEMLRRLTHRKGAVDNQTLDEFFTDPIEADDTPEDAPDTAPARRYLKILAVFVNDLQESTVYRVGFSDCTYVVVGELDGMAIGIKANAVET